MCCCLMVRPVRSGRSSGARPRRWCVSISPLSGPDVEWLGTIIARAKRQGMTTIFISHRLREVRAFCDVLTVLRNGQHIATTGVGDVGDDEVIQMIIGRS